MSAEVKKEIQLEIAHVLFIDIVGYSKLLIDGQRDYLHTLNEVVRETDSFRAAEAAGFCDHARRPGFLCLASEQSAAEPPGAAGANGNPQRTGERNYRCERSLQCSGCGNQFGAASDGLRGRWAHSSVQ